MAPTQSTILLPCLHPPHPPGGPQALTPILCAGLPEVRCLPQQADGLHQHVLHDDAAVRAGEPLRPPTELMVVRICKCAGARCVCGGDDGGD